MRQLRQADREGFQPLGKIMGRGLPFEGRIHRQHHLVNAALGNARHQPIDIEVFRAHPIKRGKPSAQHMIFAGKQTGTIERPQVGHILDNT